MRVIELFEAPDIKDPKAVRDRILTYQRIVDTSHHQGEKDAAQKMMDKLKAAAKAAGTNWESSGYTHQSKPSGAKSTYDTWAERQRAERARKNAEDQAYQKRHGHSKDWDPKWEMRDKFASNVRMPIEDVMEVVEHGNVWVAYFRNVDNPKKFNVAEWNFSTKNWVTKHPFPTYSSQAEAKVAFEKAAAKRKKFQDGFDQASAKTKSSTDAAGDPFKIYFVGHYQDNTSDKIWGWGVKGNTIYQFWGRRGGSPSLKTLAKTDANMQALNKLAKQKEAKGYTKQTSASFEEMIRKVLRTDPKFSD